MEEIELTFSNETIEEARGNSSTSSSTVSIQEQYETALNHLKEVYSQFVYSKTPKSDQEFWAGARVDTTERPFDFLVYQDGKDYKEEQFYSVVYTAEVAKKFTKSPLKNRQVVILHQQETRGALHCLLSHPQNMFELIPDLDTKAYPDFYQKVFENEDIISETDKQKLFSKAQAYYENNPDKREKMMDNELRLIAMLSVHMRQTSGMKTQFFSPRNGRHRFKITFQGELCIGLSCNNKIPGKAILYKSPGKHGIKFDCFEIITAYISDEVYDS